MARITMQRSCYNKMITQVNRHKEKHSALRKMLKGCKMTQNPAMDTIFWAPSKALAMSIVNLLTNEQQFARDPTRPSFSIAEQNIARFTKYAEEQE